VTGWEGAGVTADRIRPASLDDCVWTEEDEEALAAKPRTKERDTMKPQPADPPEEDPEDDEEETEEEETEEEEGEPEASKPKKRISAVILRVEDDEFDRTKALIPAIGKDRSFGWPKYVQVTKLIAANVIYAAGLDALEARYKKKKEAESK